MIEAVKTDRLFDADTRPGRRVLAISYAMLVVAIVLFAAATVYGYYKLRQESELAQYNSQAALWLVVSFEREYLKFDNMLLRYASADPELEADSLLTQFDVLWSRIDLMQEQSEHAKPLRQVDSYARTVPVALQLLRDHESELFGQAAAGRPLSREFLEDFRALAEPIHEFMVDTHINRSWAVKAREAQISDTRTAMFTTLGGALLSTVLLFAIVFMQLKSRHSNLQQTRAALVQSEKDRSALSGEIMRRMEVERERKILLSDLEARNEQLEGYAYTISHDLKSPLYTIQGFTGFLERDLAEGRSERIAEDLHNIRHAVQTMGKLLDDILSLSKASFGPEELKQVALDELVDQAIAHVSRELAEKGVNLTRASELPMVFGEPQRLTEVYQNLISNAAKFMGDQQNPAIEIGGRIDGGWARCYVADNGIGIDNEYRERVFNLFERLEPKTPGTGIGLAIVKRIIDGHGGSISVQSDGRGKGCRFEFTLPVDRPALADTA